VLGLTLIGMRYTTAYGVIGSFIALLAWCYYGVSVILYGAEYIQVIQLRRHAIQEGSAADAAAVSHTSQILPSSQDTDHDTNLPERPSTIPFLAASSTIAPTGNRSTSRIRPRRVA
jgi:hypothetical protein